MLRQVIILKIKMVIEHFESDFVQKFTFTLSTLNESRKRCGEDISSGLSITMEIASQVRHIALWDTAVHAVR